MSIQNKHTPSIQQGRSHVQAWPWSCTNKIKAHILIRIDSTKTITVRLIPQKKCTLTFWVGHLTWGRRTPAAGRGAAAAAFSWRLSRRIFFWTGWANQVRTLRAHFLWKCWLGIAVHQNNKIRRILLTNTRQRKKYRTVVVLHHLNDLCVLCCRRAWLGDASFQPPIPLVFPYGLPDDLIFK